jgi:uncharacterized RDD family membrane protein YckC
MDPPTPPSAASALASDLLQCPGVESEQLKIAGLTGVELTLAVAGPGNRSYAFVIDWHVRVLLAAAWLLLFWWLMKVLGLLFGDHGWKSLFALVAVWPALLIYFLYHPVLELVMQGRTPGKRMAGVRLVTRNGGLPGAGAILTRNVFRLLDSMPFFYLVGLSTCMISAQRLRIGDMAAGTVLVLDTTQSAHSLARLPALMARTGLDAGLIELVNELLERWTSLSLERRDTLARALLARTNPALTSHALADVGDADLHQRLRALL